MGISQEKIHPKALIDDLRRQTEKTEQAQSAQADLFADFNGLPNEAAKTEFYQHEANWSNRMILGDSLQVMASLAEREGLRGKVQCIYFDPPTVSNSTPISSGQRPVETLKTVTHSTYYFGKKLPDTN